jgi:hypothetical protein
MAEEVEREHAQRQVERQAKDAVARAERRAAKIEAELDVYKKAMAQSKKKCAQLQVDFISAVMLARGSCPNLFKFHPFFSLLLGCTGVGGRT